MPTLDLPLCLRMIGRAANVPDFFCALSHSARFPET
jgi:hypothetical protein